jgi:Alkylmercury lyase
MDTTVEQLLLQRAAAGFPTPVQRRQDLPATVAELHGRVLRHFAATGQAPARAILATWAAELDVGLEDALGRLVQADLVEADPTIGELAGAYPFVASPRGHQVHLRGGRTVQAYCAVDALGIPAMLDQDATITSRDPLAGVPITVEVHDGHAQWEPAPVVVGYSTEPHGPAGDGRNAGQAACCRCPLINFHASHATAQSWQQREGVRLELLEVPQALQLGAAVFGGLLRSPDAADQDPGGAAVTAPWTIPGRADQSRT